MSGETGGKEDVAVMSQDGRGWHIVSGLHAKDRTRLYVFLVEPFVKPDSVSGGSMSGRVMDGGSVGRGVFCDAYLPSYIALPIVIIELDRKKYGIHRQQQRIKQTIIYFSGHIECIPRFDCIAPCIPPKSSELIGSRP